MRMMAVTPSTMMLLAPHQRAPVFILLLLASLSPLTSSSTNLGVVLPKDDIKLWTGDTLRINCTIHDGDGANLSFVLNNSSEPEDSEVISGDMIELVIVNVTKAHRGYFWCFYNSSIMIGHANVEVANRPQPVTELSCVSPNFKYMVCTWCPEVTDVFTTYTLSWATRYDVGSCQLYQDLDGKTSACSCVFCTEFIDCTQRHPGCDSTQFYQHLEYSLTVRTISSFLSGPSVETVMMIVTNQSIVKMDPLTQLHDVYVNETEFRLSWPFPDLYSIDDWLFRVNVSYQVDEKTAWVQEPSRLLLANPHPCEYNCYFTFDFDNAHPGSEYVVSVEVKPAMSVYWSEKATIQLRTLDASPAQAPEILNFRTVDCGTDCRSITVFWQEIPPDAKNGKIQDNTLKVISSQGTERAVVVGDVLNATVEDLSKSLAYNITLAANSGGGTSPVHSFFIEKESLLSPLPEDLTAEWTSLAEEEVLLTWDTDDNSEKLLVFTCLGEGYCQEEANQTEISTPQEKLLVPFPNQSAVLGVSALKDYINGGMTSKWLCIFKYDGEVFEPNFDLNNLDNGDVKLTVNRKCVEGYSQPVKHKLKSCPEEDCQSVKDEEFDSDEYVIRGVPSDVLLTVSLQAIARTQQYSSPWVEKSVHTLPRTKEWVTPVIVLVVVLIVIVFAGILIRTTSASCRRQLFKRYGPPSVKTQGDREAKVADWLKTSPSEYDDLDSFPTSLPTSNHTYETVNGTIPGKDALLDSGHGTQYANATSSISDYATIDEERAGDSSTVAGTDPCTVNTLLSRETSSEGSEESTTSDYVKYEIDGEDRDLPYPSSGNSVPQLYEPVSCGEDSSMSTPSTSADSRDIAPILPPEAEPASHAPPIKIIMPTSPAERVDPQPVKKPLRIVLPASMRGGRKNSVRSRDTDSGDKGFVGSAGMDSSQPRDTDSSDKGFVGSAGMDNSQPPEIDLGEFTKPRTLDGSLEALAHVTHC